MPMYEYACTTCGMTFEILQRDARVLTSCGEDCVSEIGEGTIVRKMSVHTVLSGGRREASEPASCGACGNAPGSCATDN